MTSPRNQSPKSWKIDWLDLVAIGKTDPDFVHETIALRALEALAAKKKADPPTPVAK